MYKKGQAAMEFLMTYGWAILVVLAAIGALAYFGVLSPDRFLPEKCTLPSGMACLDFRWDSGNSQFDLVLQNSGGFDMNNVTVDLTPAGGTSGSCTPVDVGSLPDGEQTTVNVGCTGTSSGKFKADLVVDYINGQTGLAHTKTGELIAKV
ncbi:hypothetical protein JW707_00835 [Candidatus Woesearchaeota archaeon]|nr:hypothetical protein [Candidatus Woesearchaeota archaeon]